MNAQAREKRRGPLMWVVLGVVATFAVLGVVLLVVARATFQEKGVDLIDIRENPDIAALKLMIGMNKELEIISEDPVKKQILVRNRTSGLYFLHSMDAQTKSVKVTPVSDPSAAK